MMVKVAWIRFSIMVLFSSCMTLSACGPAESWSAFDTDWEHWKKMEDERGPMVEGAAAPLFENPPEPPATAQLPAANEDGSIDLSVEQAVFLALQHNRDLAVQRFDPIITATFENIERGAYDPELFVEGQITKQEASETTRVTGEQFNVQSEDNDTTAGIRQRLPSGTDVELSVGRDRAFSNRSPDQHESRIGLTVTQSLLRGFGPHVNLVSVRQAELETIASRYELRGFTEAVLAETEAAYWLYALSRREITIFERSLEVAKKQLDDIEQRIEVGDAAETLAAASRAEVASREQALIDARAEYETRRLRLLRLLNMSSDESLGYAITPVSMPDLNPEALTDLEDRLKLAQQMRPDLNEARLRLEQDRLQTIVTRNGLLPRLDLFITLGKSGYASSFSESIEDIDERSYDLTAGARFSQTLGNRAAEARDRAVRATRRQSAAAIENLRQIVELDVRLAWTQVDRARQQIAATAATRSLREESLRAEQERFDVGNSTSLLVAQAQRDLLQSEINEVEAVVGYRLALIDLYLSEGALLERRGVQMADGR